MNQKGFANIIFIALVVILAGAVGYLTLVKNSTSPAPVSGPAPSASPTSTSAPTPSSTLVLMPKSGGKTPAHLISPDQIAQMETLMKKNGKSLGGLQAYSFKKDEIGMTHIPFYVYVNDVRVNEFWNDNANIDSPLEIVYHFKADGMLSSITNDHASIFSNISTTPEISESQAIAIASSKIGDSSLVANREFWNKNVGGGIKDTKSIVLVWKVEAGNGGASQFAIIDAQTGNIIYTGTTYYDNGIRY